MKSDEKSANHPGARFSCLFLFIADDEHVSALGQIVAQRVPTAAGFGIM